MTWKRARSAGQKAERYAAILVAAGELFDGAELGEISMVGIAKKAGLGKASLYSYFKTKEEVFASLFLKECGIWLDAVESRFTEYDSASPDDVASLLTKVLRENERFCRLTVVLASVLERNLSNEFLYDFKVEINAALARFVQDLHSVLPHISDSRGTEFLYQHQSLIAGGWPLANPSPEVANVMQKEEFDGMRMDFFDLFEKSIARLLSK